ncbi:restculine oxidase precursor [Apiospora saccharicola]|uniref:Restculine oxidase n=1 Tax=Apiospora saccharicola TaxID=335842 RepID=A0ABR1U459_9PEZI
MKSLLSIAICVLLLAYRTLGYNFPFEAVQPTPADTEAFSAIAFGDAGEAHPVPDSHGCRVFPGEASWPPVEEWESLTVLWVGRSCSLSRRGAVCYKDSHYYDQAACNRLLTSARSSRYYIDDPVTEMTVWTQGRTCPVTNNPEGNCMQGGFPAYVVNAKTVKQVQMGVNFARNRKLRLVVKNTGHDFVGRSVGAGSLSIWTHHLKDFEFAPQYQQGGSRGMAAKVSSGLESWEMFSFMECHNMTLVVPSDSTVGVYGGWMTGGGHSPIASLYGLGADQPLSLQVVTADGRFVTADPDTNPDLYYALRGGGPARDWEDPQMYADIVAALRYSVEAGYQFHGIHLAPTEEAAARYGSGQPPNNGVSDAWRRATMHADLFERVGDYSTKGKALASYARFNESMARWRAASPDAGVYVNEAGLLEPRWQEAFWGDKYAGLVAIKRRYDPWDLFWAPNTVGSEGWAVETEDFLPSQNGRLCRVASQGWK